MIPDIPFRDALAVWWRIGLLSFGGPAGQIALMHRIIVEERRWLDEARFLHALNYCMLLPGPEAQQLATYVGWLLHGVRGGLTAGLLFILPGALAILLLSCAYVLLGDLDVMAGLFFGLKAAVLAIVLQALLRIAKRTLSGTFKPLLALAAFVALFVFNLPFPLVVLSAGLLGYAQGRWFDTAVRPAGAASEHGSSQGTLYRRGTRRTAALCLLLWLSTVLGLRAVLGEDQVFAQLALFFSKMAVVTFGGAYAVLAYVAQQGVENYQWLQPGQMIDGLALAETTPGPLILVTQFVGFLGAYRQAPLEPALLAAIMGAALTTWVTFLPCFVWIFAGAPYVEALRGRRALNTALAAITASVVGVIANLALWFALHALFVEHRRLDGHGVHLLLPVPASIDWTALALALIAFALLFGWRLGVVPTLAICAGLGGVLRWL